MILVRILDAFSLGWEEECGMWLFLQNKVVNLLFFIFCISGQHIIIRNSISVKALGGLKLRSPWELILRT